MPVSILDYGLGNLGSIRNMFRKIGAEAIVVATPEELPGASKILLPGVGSFDAGMRALQARGLVGPFVLRRAKDAPEVDLELPPITIEKVPCSLTVEQASLYRATVDSWMPRIERHEKTFDRRGAVLAMLGRLKQVCNHPASFLGEGDRRQKPDCDQAPAGR